MFSILFVCRVSCMVAGKEDITASAVVCLGYPLKVVFYLLGFASLLLFQKVFYSASLLFYRA